MRLRSQSVRIEAPRELVFEVVSAAGKEVGEAGEEKLIEFETGWRGRVFKTVEAVTFDRPDRIVYRWTQGPLSNVEEEIHFARLGPRQTEMSYRGAFKAAPGLFGWLRSFTLVRPIFNGVVREHLEEGKRLSEQRASRSRLYQH
jgi:hypothetical protein